MNHAGKAASGGHLHEALLLSRTEAAGGLSQQDHVSEDRAPLSRELMTIRLYPYPYKIWIHFTIFLCTQQLLKEKQGRPT